MARRARRTFRKLRRRVKLGRKMRLRRGNQMNKWQSLHSPKRTAKFSIDLTVITHSTSAWYVAGDVTTTIGDGIAPTAQPLVPVALITKLAATWKYIRPIGYNLTFDWSVYQGPGSSEAQDTDQYFYWQPKLPQANPAETAAHWLVDKATADKHGCRKMIIRHHQKWQITERFLCMKENTLWGGQTADNKNNWSWKSPPWMRTDDVSATSDLALVRMYEDGYAMTGLTNGDEIKISGQLLFECREPILQ